MRSLAQSKTPCTWRRPFVGTWETSSVSGGHAGPAHEGNSRTMGTHAGEESDGCVVPVKPRTMPSDIGGGDGGGKAAGRGEGELQRMLRRQRRTKHVTEAASPRIGAVWVPNTPKADHVRPETGAGCGKAARPDLRGGRGAILVPTATSRTGWGYCTKVCMLGKQNCELAQLDCLRGANGPE